MYGVILRKLGSFRKLTAYSKVQYRVICLITGAQLFEKSWRADPKCRAKLFCCDGSRIDSLVQEAVCPDESQTFSMQLGFLERTSSFAYCTIRRACGM